MPFYALHTITPSIPAEAPHPGGILQLIFKAFAAARPLQTQHDAAAMKRLTRIGFMATREPYAFAPHRPLYAQCLYRADESGLTKDVPKGEAGGANGCKQRAS